MEDEVIKLWEPSRSFSENSNLKKYMRWLSAHVLSFPDYQSLWQWSVDQPETFWRSLWRYFEVMGTEFDEVMTADPMPDTRWFTGSRLNFSEHIFRQSTTQRPAIIARREGQAPREISWKTLEVETARLQEHLNKLNIRPGDRIAAYLPNIPEATIGFLATNALGAVWSSCSPDFGVSAVTDRFAQIEPRVLIAVNGYQYGGKTYDKMTTLEQIIEQLPTLEEVILIDYVECKATPTWKIPVITWQELPAPERNRPEFIRVPFDHPIWILYSSGTTGIPKAITHGHGGILLELLKFLHFHSNIQSGDRCFWYTTTGWMMWNYLHGALLCGATVVLYDGSPAWPQTDMLWKLAEECGINHLGTSAAYITACMKEGFHPGREYTLDHLISIGSTGSPLTPEGFKWVYDSVGSKVWLTSLSGGTDVCSAFVGGNPLWPVYQGEIQCRALGCGLEAYNENGHCVEDEVGEMVITGPMPSMPLYFWNDPDKKRYRESYFDHFPGVWRHGDWIRITPRKGVVIYGRSDATLNRGGVRIGTSEIYRAVSQLDEVTDSLVICLEKDNGDFYMPLFVTLREHGALDDILKKKIAGAIREATSPRHVPDDITEVDEIPYTISGKKTETPVKKILMGLPADKTIKKDALRNPAALDFFIKLAGKL